MFDKDSQFSPILLFNKQKQENICHFFLRFQHIFSRISFPPANNHHLVFPPHISVTITLHVVFIPPPRSRIYWWRLIVSIWMKLIHRVFFRGHDEKQKH